MSFLEFADSRRIIVMILPAHSTHRLQPLDVGLFSPLATAYSKRLTEIMAESHGMVSMGKGVQVSRDRYNRTLTMTQTTYLTKVLGDHGMLDCNSIKTPMETGINLVPSTIQATEDDTKAYQSAIGSLMYAMTATRPDIAFAVSVLSRFSSKPDTTHWKALKRVFRYLNGTLHRGITYGGVDPLEHHDDRVLTGYSDADWEDCISACHLSAEVLLPINISWRLHNISEGN